MAGKNSIRNSIQWVLFVMSVLLTISWWMTASEILDLSAYYPLWIGIGLGSVVLIQSGALTYFKESKYKTINFDDAITWSLALVAGAIYSVSLLSIPRLSISMPAGFISFLFKIYVGVGLIAIIVHLISVISIITKRGG